MQEVLEAEGKKAKLTGLMEELLDECKARQHEEDGEEHPSISGRLLRMRDPLGRPLSRDRLLQEFLIFFIAGSETTGHTIAWTLCALFLR
jgi:fatty acid synthase